MIRFETLIELKLAQLEFFELKFLNSRFVELILLSCGTQSCTSKGIRRQGVGSFGKEFLDVSTLYYALSSYAPTRAFPCVLFTVGRGHYNMPCRHYALTCALLGNDNNNTITIIISH